jgi:hypothetical protein
MKNKTKWRESERDTALSIQRGIRELMVKLQRVRKKDYGVHKFAIGYFDLTVR